MNIAARLEPMADPGGICLSEAVYQQVRDRLDVPVEDMGLSELKNIQYPVRIFSIAPIECRPSRPLVAREQRPAAAAARLLDATRRGRSSAIPAESPGGGAHAPSHPHRGRHRAALSPTASLPHGRRAADRRRHPALHRRR